MPPQRTLDAPAPPNAPRPPRRGKGRRLLAVTTGILLLTGLTTGLARPASAAPQHAAWGHDHQRHSLTVVADNNADGTQESYRLSTTDLLAGRVQVTLFNAGSAEHQVQLMQLHPGVTPDSYRAALLATGGGAALALADAAGGIAAIQPGSSGSGAVWLHPGIYVALCFQVGGGQGVPHFVHGMYASFQVHDTTWWGGWPKRVDGTVASYSFGYRMPAVLNGHGLYRFVNTAPVDSHEMQILRLLPGKTAQDVKTWLAAGMTGAPPVSGAYGGAGGVAPGGQMWIRLHLAPGRYVAVCFIPDDEPPHHSHAELGMVQGFRVR